MSVPASQMNDPNTPYFELGLRRTQQALFPQAPSSTGPSGAAGSAPASGGGASFGATLMEEATKRGKALDDDEIEDIRQQYVDKHVVPGLWGQKGMSQGKFDALKTVFDNNSERAIAKYKASLTGGAASSDSKVSDKDYNSSPVGGGFFRGLKDTAATTLTSAVGGTASGVLQLADYGVRALPGVDWDKQTFLGRGADIVDAATEGVDRALVSDETLKSRNEFSALLERDAPLEEISAFVAKHPSSLTGMLGQTIGFLSPAALTKLPKVIRGITALRAGGKLSQTAAKAVPIALTGVPGVGQAGGGYERQIMASPIEDLIKTPEAAKTYAAFQAAGLDEKAFRRHMAAEGLPMVLGTSAVANLALPGLNPFNVEAQIASKLGRGLSRTRRAAYTAGSESVEEGAASAIEKVGSNLGEQSAGKDTPTGKGVSTAAIMGSAMGAVVGGGIAAIPGQQAGPRTDFDVPPTPAEIEAAAAAANAPPGTVVPPTPAGPAAPNVPAPMAAGPGIAPEAHATALTGAANAASVAAANGRSAAGKGIKATTDPLDLVGKARVFATTLPNFAGMSPTQQLDVVEVVATEFGKKAKASLSEVAALLGAERTAINATPATPPVTATPVPTSITPDPVAPVASAPVEATPEPVAPVAAPAVPPVAAPATASPEAFSPLPVELSKAAPRYKSFELNFESDADRALYIVAGKTPSKSDAKYLTWIRENLGFDEATARTEGAAVRARIAELSKGIHPEDGPIRVAREVARAPVAATVTPTAKPLRTKAPAPPVVAATPTEAPPAKAGRLKKAPKPPKQVAPVPTAAGAQEPTSEAPTASPSVPVSSESREAATDAVARILGDSIEEADAKALADAIDLAREGDTKALEAELKELSGVTQPDKVALREAGKSLAPAARGEVRTEETNEPVGEPYVVEDGRSEHIRVRQNLKNKNAEQAVEWLAANGPNPGYRYIARMVLARIKAMQAKGVQFEFVMEALANGTAGVTRSTTKVVNGGLRYRVRISLNSATNIKQSGTNFQTALHEYIHAVTGTMLSMARKNLGIPRSAKALVDIDALYKTVKEYASRVDTVIPSELSGGANAFENADELLAWGLTNKTMQEFLARIPVGPKKTGLSRLLEIVGDVLGIKTEYQSALDQILTISEDLMSGDIDAWMDTILKLANNSTTFAQLETDSSNLFRGRGQEPAKPISIGNIQRIGETMANATYGLERAEQEVRKAGKTVEVDESPYIAGRKFTSDKAEIAGIDNEEIIAPIAVWITKNWSKFGDTLAEFHTRSDAFFQAHHQLHERLPDLWRQYVPLEAGMDFARDILIDKANDGKITPEEFYQQLRELVAKHKSMSLSDWAVKNGQTPPNVLRERLEALKKQGYDENTLSEYNAMFKPARDRLQEHMTASGRISPNDPWVKARNWKWYFPLKGDAKVNDFAADADYGTFKGAIRPFRTRGIETTEGRTTRAASVAEQLVTDMNAEGEKLAEAEFKAALFAFYQTHKELMGASKLTVIRGTPKQGFTRTAYVKKNGKRVAIEKPVKADQVFVEPANGFVFHNGDTHFRVELDVSNQVAGQLDRGVKGFRSVHSPKNPALKAVGMITNFMARSYTTYSPEWQFFVGFARDLNYIPATLAIEIFDSPLQAGAFVRGYTKRVIGNTLGVANIARTLEELGGRKDLLKTRLSNDVFLQQLAAYRAAGGSTEFAQSLNPEAAYNLLFGKAERKGLKGRSKQLYEGINEVTSNWAQLLENKGRVAAFTTLVEDMKMDPKEAAARVKGVMDFGQSGEYGRMINAWLAFYRVGATGSDVMRRAFTTPTGKADWPKLAKWSTFFAGLGAAAYMLAAAMLGDDEDGIPRIKKYDINTLTAKLVLPGEKATGYSIGLGLPQLLLAPGIIGAALTNEAITGKEAANAMYEVITRNAPLQPAGWAEGTGGQGFVSSWLEGALLPTAGRPMFETTTNTNAFDSAIHTTFKNPKKFRSEQGMGVTPKEWKDAAIELRDWTGIDMYPEDIRHFAKGYLGQALSSVMREMADNENTENSGLDSQPVRGALRLKLVDEDFYYSRELKRSLKALNNTKKRQDAAEAAGALDEFNASSENRTRLSALKALEKAKKHYYDDLTRIRESNMALEGKRLQRKRADRALRVAVESAQEAVELDD